MALTNNVNGVGTYHMSDDPTNYEPARSGFFTFIVSDIDGILKPTVDPTLGEYDSNDVINNAQEVIKLSVNAASVPTFSLGQIDIKRGNSTVHYAGTPTFNDDTLECEDYVGLRTKDVLLAWKALAYDVRNDLGGRASNYKKTCTLVEYTQDYEEIRSWTLYGCWVKDTSEDNFDKSNGDTDRKITATIVYDRAIQNEPNKINN